MAKWVGLVACGLLICLYGANLRWTIQWASIMPRADGGSVVRIVTSENGAIVWRSGLNIARPPRAFSDVSIGQREYSFYWWCRRYSGDGGGVEAIVPLWMPLLVLAVPTFALGYFDRRSAHRRRMGLCPKCGYDLRGLPATGGAARCPECGLESARAT